MKKNIIYVIALGVFGLVGFVACSGSDSKNSSATNPSSPYTYEFSEVYANNVVRCSTQAQVFNNLTEMCQGLQNEMLNRNCAVQQRMQKYRDMGCAGPTTTTPTAPPVATSPGVSVDNSAKISMRCEGTFRHGTDEIKKIDKTFDWYYQRNSKMVIARFSNSRELGEYSLVHIRGTQNNDQMILVARGIDGEKNQSIRASIDAKIQLQHKDSDDSGVEVDVTCRRSEAPIRVVDLEKKKITCIGYFTSVFDEIIKKPISLTIDPTGAAEKTYYSFKDRRKDEVVLPEVKVYTENTTEGFKMGIIAKKLDNHIELMNEVINSGKLEFQYGSVGDRREISINCGN